MDKLVQIQEDLQKYLSKFRYEHSVRVAEEAKELACRYHFDEDKAYIAGLVHDIAREFNFQENQQWIVKYELSLEWLLEENRDIVHAEIGALVVKKWYGLDDDICQAVRYHTIGHVPMNLLEKIVFIADKIGRKTRNSTLERVRILAYQDIDRAMILCLENQKQKLTKLGKQFHPDSELLLQNLINMI